MTVIEFFQKPSKLVAVSALAVATMLAGCNASIREDGTLADCYVKDLVLPNINTTLKANYKPVEDRRKWVETGSNLENINNYWIDVCVPFTKESFDRTIGYVFVNMGDLVNVSTNIPLSKYLPLVVQESLDHAGVSNQNNLEVQTIIKDLWIAHGGFSVGDSIAANIISGQFSRRIIEDVGYKYEIEVQITNKETGVQHNVTARNIHNIHSTWDIDSKQEELSNQLFASLSEKLVDQLKSLNWDLAVPVNNNLEDSNLE